MKPGLSVVLATYNEEASIEATLQSVAHIANEIIVADGKSSDSTVAIAKKYKARVLLVPNQSMFHINKQLATNAAHYEWILELDADEIVTPHLALEIAQVVAGTHKELNLDHFSLYRRHMNLIANRDQRTYSAQPPINGYFIARKNFFLGGYLMHSAVFPDGVIRLVRNGKAAWPCRSVHEQTEIDGGVSWLQEPMIHMADPTFSRYLRRANRYTTLTAGQMQSQGVQVSVVSTLRYMFIKPILIFLLLFIRHKGFLDGFSGFVWSLMSGLHWSIAYLKLIEKQKGNADNKPVVPV